MVRRGDRPPPRQAPQVDDILSAPSSRMAFTYWLCLPLTKSRASSGDKHRADSRQTTAPCTLAGRLPRGCLEAWPLLVPRCLFSLSERVAAIA